MIIIVISGQVLTLVYHLNKLGILFRLAKSVPLFSCVLTLLFVKTIELEV